MSLTVGNSTVSLGESTELRILGSDRLQLLRGSMRMSTGPKVEVETTHGIVSAEKADVAVQVSETGTQVVCIEGLAALRNSTGQTESCLSGELLVMRPGTAPRQAQLADFRTVALWKNITDPDQAPEFQPFP